MNENVAQLRQALRQRRRACRRRATAPAARTGTYVCNGPNATKCSAVKTTAPSCRAAAPSSATASTTTATASSTSPSPPRAPNPAYFVKPAVTKIARRASGSCSYEASRPSATTIVAGHGQRLHCAAFNANDPNCNDNTIPVAPAGVTLDKTPACSVPSKIPWFNVTPIEAEQTCTGDGRRALHDGRVADGAVRPPCPCQLGLCPARHRCTSKAVQDDEVLQPRADLRLRSSTAGHPGRAAWSTGSRAAQELLRRLVGAQGNLAGEQQGLRHHRQPARDHQAGGERHTR